jgi:gas vesicle protein
MWRLKYLIIGMLPAAIVGVALYFLAPAMADELRTQVRESAQDSVQEVFEDSVSNTVEVGQLVVTEADIARALENSDADSDTWRVNGVSVEIDGGRVTIYGENDNGADTVEFASAVPAIENGQFVLNDRSGFLSIFKTAQDAIADEMEVQVNALFSRSGVVPVSVTAEDGRMVIVTEASATAVSQ